MNITLKTPIRIVASVYLLSLLFLLGIQYWPESMFWLASLVCYTPTSLIIIPWVFLFPTLLYSQRWILASILTIITLLTGYIFSNFEFNINSIDQEILQTQKLTVLSANLGGTDPQKIALLIKNIQPDIISLQEVTAAQIKHQFDHDPWNVICESHLCLISRYQLKLVNAVSRNFLQDWGDFIMHVEINSPSKMIDFYNVHLETPREGIEALIKNPIKGIAKMKDVTEHQLIESGIASNLAKKGHLSIIAGDFNMTELSPIYQTYWANYENSFAQKGTGFGYSKSSKWIGVRIDHILYDKNAWSTKRAWVGPSIDSDHLPIITILTPSN